MISRQQKLENRNLKSDYLDIIAFRSKIYCLEKETRVTLYRFNPKTIKKSKMVVKRFDLFRKTSFSQVRINRGVQIHESKILGECEFNRLFEFILIYNY